MNVSFSHVPSATCRTEATPPWHSEPFPSCAVAPNHLQAMNASCGGSTGMIRVPEARGSRVIVYGDGACGGCWRVAVLCRAVLCGGGVTQGSRSLLSRRSRRLRTARARSRPGTSDGMRGEAVVVPCAAT